MGLDIAFIIKFKDETEKILTYRKVNFLRKFIFDNTSMEYDDNCAEIEVSRELFEKLYDKTEEVLCLEHIEEAANILPTLGGFFFGNTDYDEYYIQNVRQVHDDIDEILYGKDITGNVTFEDIDTSFITEMRIGKEIRSITYTDWW